MPKSKATIEKHPHQIVKDEQGHEVLKNHNQEPLCMEWEKPFIEAYIQYLNPKDKVLLVGFGLGYAADRIYSLNPKSLTIIETNPTVLERIKIWSKDKKNIQVIQESWKNPSSLGKFDAIFFNQFEPFSLEELELIKNSANSFSKIAEETQNLRTLVAEAFQETKTRKFTDQEVEKFIKEELKKPHILPIHLLQFLNNLSKLGNISTAQRDKYAAEIAKQEKNGSSVSSSNALAFLQKTAFQNEFLNFVQIAFDHLLNINGRLSAYAGTPSSRVNLEEVKTKLSDKKNFHYEEKLLKVTIPEQCSYFHGDHFILFVMEKKK